MRSHPDEPESGQMKGYPSEWNRMDVSLAGCVLCLTWEGVEGLAALPTWCGSVVTCLNQGTFGCLAHARQVKKYLAQHSWWLRFHSASLSQSCSTYTVSTVSPRSQVGTLQRIGKSNPCPLGLRLELREIGGESRAGLR